MGYLWWLWWIGRQAEKQGVPVVATNPKGTSTRCPRCGSGLREVRRRYMRCPSCGFGGDRGIVAVLNIRAKTLKMGDLCLPRLPPDDR